MRALSGIALAVSGLASGGIAAEMDNAEVVLSGDRPPNSGLPDLSQPSDKERDLQNSSSSIPDTVEVGASGDAKEWKKPTAEEHAYIQATKSQRMRERRERVRQAMANMKPESKLERMSKEELEKAYSNAQKDGIEKDQHQWIRRAMENGDRSLWGSSSTNVDPYEQSGLADNGEYYDKWQQAYRFLGGFIDCDHSWSEGSHDNNNHNSGDNNNGNNNGPCSRWMMWAAYIDPNYAGGGYDEYFGDNAEGSLDCHSPDTDWVLIGVYRQEFYQYIEQISKHLWAIDEYEYIVALAGLKYMTKYECFGVGYDENGNQLYAAVRPIEGGEFQMGLYSDVQCLVLAETDYTYDDFAEKSDLYLGSKDQTDDDAFHNQAYQYWYATQEYTFENLNTVYSDFKFCTSCVDYPTYQDGYFIGDDGTDDDDLINQCWKFYSHDSFNCDAECVAMGAQQGTITWVSYNGRQFGQLIDGQYDQEHDKTTLGDNGETTKTSSKSAETHRLDRLKANLFLTVAGIIFVATFLAFAVARGSSKKKASSSRSRSRRLLDADYQGSSSGDRHRSSRSQSRSARERDDRTSSSKSRSKSRTGARTGTSSRSSGATSSGRSRSKSAVRSGDYKPPSDSRSDRDRDRERERERSERRKSRSQSQSRKKSSSSRRVDDF